MVLITSAQVSVAISSVIVFFSTTALFMSGYALQQQTVRDLRAAIKPQILRGKAAPGPTQFNDDGYLVDMVQIETQPTKEDLKEQVVEDSRSASTGTDEEAQENVETESADMVGATRWQKAARRKKLEEAKQKPMMDDATKESSQKETAFESKPEEKPISGAERRRKIKEQIVAEGQGETFKGYRRRMW